MIGRLVLIVEDPSAPLHRPFVHAIAAIPARNTTLPGGALADGGPAMRGAVLAQGRLDGTYER